jgi:hypothetical protein
LKKITFDKNRSAKLHQKTLSVGSTTVQSEIFNPKNTDMKRFYLLALFFFSLSGVNAQNDIEHDDVYASKEDRYALAVMNDFQRRQAEENNRRTFEANRPAEKYSPRYDYYRNNDATSRMYRNNYDCPCWGPTWSTCGSGWRSSFFMGGSAMMNTPWSWYAWNTPNAGFYNPYSDPFNNPYAYNSPYSSYYNPYGAYYNPWAPVGYNPWLYVSRGSSHDIWKYSHRQNNPYGQVSGDSRPEFYQTRTRENRNYRGSDNKSLYPGTGNSGTTEPSYRERNSSGKSDSRSSGGTTNPGGSGGTRTRRGG